MVLVLWSFGHLWWPYEFCSARTISSGACLGLAVLGICSQWIIGEVYLKDEKASWEISWKKKIQSLVLSGSDAFKDPIFLFVFGNKIELLEV